MLVLYLVLIVFHGSKLCVIIKHFLFYHFQRFATIVDIFLKILKKLSKFFFINAFYFLALNIICSR